MVEMKVDEFEVPQSIGFNYAELKQYVGEIVSQYAGTIVTEDTIPAAKADLAKLRKADKAMNDRRIELEKRYKEPFDKFKAQVDDIRGDLQKAEQAINQQLKEFDYKTEEEKRGQIKALYAERDSQVAEQDIPAYGHRRRTYGAETEDRLGRANAFNGP